MGKDMGGDDVPCKLPCCKCAALQGAPTCGTPGTGGQALGPQPAMAVSESPSFIREPEDVEPEQKAGSGEGDGSCIGEEPTAVATPDTPLARLTKKASGGQQGLGAAEVPNMGQGEWEVQQRGRRTSTDRRAPPGGMPAGPKHSPAPPRAPGGPQLRSAAGAVSGSHGPVPIGATARTSCAASGETTSGRTQHAAHVCTCIRLAVLPPFPTWQLWAFKARSPGPVLRPRAAEAATAGADGLVPWLLEGCWLGPPEVSARWRQGRSECGGLLKPQLCWLQGRPSLPQSPAGALMLAAGSGQCPSEAAAAAAWAAQARCWAHIQRAMQAAWAQARCWVPTQRAMQAAWPVQARCWAPTHSATPAA